jgi:hypothetical protein
MPVEKFMASRAEWLKLQMRHCRLWACCRLVLMFITFEVYYLLCNLIGYRTRHFLEPMPAELRSLRVGDRILITWPHIPTSIWLLDRIVPFAYMAHTECVPYTPEAEMAARRAGRRVEVTDVVAGEFKAGSR